MFRPDKNDVPHFFMRPMTTEAPPLDVPPPLYMPQEFQQLLHHHQNPYLAYPWRMMSDSSLLKRKRKNKRRRVDTGVSRNTYGQNLTLSKARACILSHTKLNAPGNSILAPLPSPSGFPDQHQQDQGNVSQSSEVVDDRQETMKDAAAIGVKLENNHMMQGFEDSFDQKPTTSAGEVTMENGDRSSPVDSINSTNDHPIDDEGKENPSEILKMRDNYDEDDETYGDEEQTPKSGGEDDSVLAKRARVENIVSSMRQSPNEHRASGPRYFNGEFRRKNRKPLMPQQSVTQNPPQLNQPQLPPHHYPPQPNLNNNFLQQLNGNFACSNNACNMEKDQCRQQIIYMKQQLHSLEDRFSTFLKDSPNSMGSKDAGGRFELSRKLQHPDERGYPIGGKSLADDVIVELNLAITDCVKNIVKKFLPSQAAKRETAARPTHSSTPMSSPVSLPLAGPPPTHQGLMARLQEMNTPQHHLSPPLSDDGCSPSEPQPQPIAVPRSLPTSVAVLNPSLYEMHHSHHQHQTPPPFYMPSADSHPKLYFPETTQILEQGTSQGLYNCEQQESPLSFAMPSGMKSACSTPPELDDSNRSKITEDSPMMSSGWNTNLTPSHLKKAKLMFFYVRYPNSATLRQHFPDVKFTRHNNAQLIKWFSNFREYFYIQIEKYARQAISEGFTAVEQLTVNEESELYRTLNLHYNKSNQFQVPAHFIDGVRITLQEFFNAIIARKDADPSWKKQIYKVINKLDTPLPDAFRSPTFLENLESS